MRRLILILFANLVMAGSGAGDDQSNDQPEVSGMLRKVRSAAELENSLKTSIPRVAGISQPLPTGTTGGASGDYSSPYPAEEGVDEFHVVR